MNEETIEKKARKLCRHTVCYTDHVSRLIAIRALQGVTTKAIAEELEITPVRVQYAILKAQHALGANVRFRRDYRNGKGSFAESLLRATEGAAEKLVHRKIAPIFRPFAAPGVPRE